MTEINDWVWIVDKNEMSSRNAEHNVTVKMEMKGGAFFGKLNDMPIELFGEIAALEDGEKIIAQIVRAAEEAYKKQV